MSLLKNNLRVAASSLFVLASVACSNPPSTALTPPASTPPAGVTFLGGTFGGACSGTFYIGAGTGWAFCDNGTWAYTTSDPSNDYYSELFPTSDGGVTPCPDGGTYEPGSQGGGQEAPTAGSCH